MHTAAPLENKIAIVTGGTRGIGLAIALRLAKIAKVYICSRYPPKISLPDTHWIQCDVANEAGVDDFLDGVKEHAGSDRVDILINNAGVATSRDGRRVTIEEISLPEWERCLAVNLTGAFLLCRKIVPLMKNQFGGKIVNISSASARCGGIFAGVDYISSKSGIIGLTKGLAFELRNVGINVNAIAPGRIDTEMIRDFDSMDDWARREVTLGRLGTPDDIAGLVEFLCSDAAAYIHGATFDCNGGWIMS
ncbi:SDR family NAD(P)-dependent oxidoreductase [Burkholderia sp. BCC1630]|uniref:SDR family NAD(P)-dependent oxidoreductase n=1 Tax=Burkholderia sp. BCC1630 TaxID=2676304 RepID=UPI001589AAF9|nr:SDR family NAD(P)-dependent oxidoreductase [Burkholderia sp. BCC1630]